MFQDETEDDLKDQEDEWGRDNLLLLVVLMAAAGATYIATIVSAGMEAGANGVLIYVALAASGLVASQALRWQIDSPLGWAFRVGAVVALYVLVGPVTAAIDAVGTLSTYFLTTSAIGSTGAPPRFTKYKGAGFYPKDASWGS